MFKTTVAVLTVAAVSAKAPDVKSVSVSADSNVNGVEGLNLNWEVPFKLDEAVVGFRYKLNELKKYPENLFAKKSFEVADGTATVDADVHLDSKILSVAAKWVSDKTGLTLHANGDSKNQLNSVGLESSQKVNNQDLTLKGSYDVHSQKTQVSAKVRHEKTEAQASYNTADEDLVLAVSHDLDDQNTLSPTYSTKTGHVSYGWTRKWNGGELDTTFHPGNKAVLEWTDKGHLGDWKTKAEVPLDDAKNIKVSFNRDWKY